MNNYIDTMNSYGTNRTPFLFIINFDKTSSIVQPLSDIKNSEILYDIGNHKNYSLNEIYNTKKKVKLNKTPIPFTRYSKAFDILQDNFKCGNSFLTNLTFPTEIKINHSLEEIFYLSKAKYKLFLKNQFVVFSPEIFIKIKNNSIFSYPMKGTIDASIDNAEKKILENEKEFAEHITIVDLIRNDLGMVSTNVTVEKFRYIDHLITHDSALLQVSSKIKGELEKNFHKKIGTIIDKLLPAGSITGAPKKKTVEIIKEAEQYDRGFYTGIAGIFDGYNLDSFVMIRFIEKDNDKIFYKSGGGITIYSDVKSEYQELKDKVYVPIY